MRGGQAFTPTLSDVPRGSPLSKSGRYNPREIALRVERMRVETRTLAKEVAADVGLTESQWSKKMALRGSSFTILELGRIADYFAKATNRSLTGWPFIDATVSDLLDRIRTPNS